MAPGGLGTAHTGRAAAAAILLQGTAHRPRQATRGFHVASFLVQKKDCPDFYFQNLGILLIN